MFDEKKKKHALDLCSVQSVLVGPHIKDVSERGGEKEGLERGG